MPSERSRRSEPVAVEWADTARWRPVAQALKPVPVPGFLRRGKKWFLSLVSALGFCVAVAGDGGAGGVDFPGAGDFGFGEDVDEEALGWLVGREVWAVNIKKISTEVVKFPGQEEEDSMNLTSSQE